MKIVLLSGASSIHTVRWANGLADAGHKVHVVTKHPIVNPFARDVRVHSLPYRGVLGYFTMVLVLRKLLRHIKPDLVNAHYASGYGTTACLLNYRPWLLSVWGSDVYDFPYKSPLHRWIVTRNLRAADAVASTSHCMALQVRSLDPQLGNIAITPFGVDMSLFSHAVPSLADKPYHGLTIGTVKTLSPKYGIDTLIRSFSILINDLLVESPDIAKNLRLRIVGGGSQKLELEKLARNLGIRNAVDFVGPVLHALVPAELAKMDIFVALSRSESFGVAAIEAGAAGLPVLVSDAGGLPEVVLNNKTGLVVPKDNPQEAANALYRLVRDGALRQQFGSAGKQHVAESYAWPNCIQTMISVYEKTIASYHGRQKHK